MFPAQGVTYDLWMDPSTGVGFVAAVASRWYSANAPAESGISLRLYNDLGVLNVRLPFLILNSVVTHPPCQNLLLISRCRSETVLPRRRNFGDFMLTRAWEIVFQDAVHEADPTMAEVKIRRAEAAILRCIQYTSASPGPAEEQALFNALRTIRLLRSARRIPK